MRKIIYIVIKMTDKKENDILEIFGSELDDDTLNRLKIQRNIMLQAEQLELETETQEYLPDPSIGTPILLMTRRIYGTRHKYKKYRTAQFMSLRGYDTHTVCTYAGSYFYKDGEDSSELPEETAMMIYFIHEFKHGMDIEWRNTELFPEDMVII